MPGVTGKGAKITNTKLSHTTNKSIEAEMRNKRETARLQLQKRILDRQVSYTRYAFEKDRKEARQFLTKMKETSGISSEGAPLEGPWDRDYAKTNFARSTMSDRRLRQWRFTEDRVQRDIGPSLATKTPVAKKETEEEAADKLKVILGMMGYDDNDIIKILNHIQNTSQKRAMDRQSIKMQNRKCKDLIDMDIKHIASVPDVFECLRNIDDDIDLLNSASTITTTPSSFSVDDWEQSLINNYTNAATSRPVAPSKPRRIRSAQAISRRFEKTYGAAPVRRVRSANGNSRTTKSPSDDKWAIKTVAFNEYPVDIHVDKFKNVESDDALEPLLEVIEEALSDISEVSMPANANRKPVRPHTTTGSRRESMNMVPERPSTAGSMRRSSLKERKVTPAINGTRRHSETAANVVGNGNVNDQTNGTIERQSQSTTSVRSSVSNTRSILKSNSSSSFKSLSSCSSGKSDQSDIFDPSVEFNAADTSPKTRTRSARFSLDPKYNRHRASFSVQTRKPSFGSVKSGKLLKRSSSAYVDPAGSSTSSMGDAFAMSTLRRASVPAAIYKQRPASVGDLKDTELVADENGQLLPRWKRDLLRESPGSLHTNQPRSRVHGVISKSRRMRELERLKEENQHDVQRLCDEEQERRNQSRWNVLKTMQLVKHAVDTLKMKAEETRSRSGTQSSEETTES